MKKIKLFLSMFAIASMLIGTSCSNEELVNNSSNEDYVSAKFTINTPELALNTRAAEIGDGTKADMVVCAVFDMYDQEMTDLRQYLPIKDNAAQYSIRLAKGQNYRVVFFAYHASDNDKEKAEFYNIEDLKNIAIYDTQSNIEERDAFTAYYDVETGKTMQPINEDITLYRPFAQLNLGTCNQDWADAIKAGVEVANTQIKVSNVYTKFSAFDDAVVGEPKEVTFALNAKPTDALSAMNDNWVYLALNYLLVGDKKNEKNLTDVEFVWQNEDGSKTNNPTTVFHNVPVQRNYRTNILGWLLTNEAVFNISIDERFEKPDYNMVAVDGTQTAAELAKTSTPNFIDEGQREVAIIENMHITADETAIVVDDINAPSGTLVINNSTINAKLFMELNMYYTIIVRNSHLNVERLFEITTGKTAYQFVFINCYLNGEPMVEEKKSEYFDQNFLSLNTVNIEFSNKDNVVVPDNVGDNGNNGEGGNEGEGGNTGNEGEGGNTGNEGEGGNTGNEGEGGTQTTPQPVKFSDIVASLPVTNGFSVITEKYDHLIIDIDATIAIENTEIGLLEVNAYITASLENTTFTKKPTGFKDNMQMWVIDCKYGETPITKDNFKSVFGFDKTFMQSVKYNK